MIKFFRKIRRKLLTENRFSKYLFYAIGEILLVVIGILIALSVNNWNNQRNNYDQMTSFLKSLKDDLKRDTLNFNSAIRRYEAIIEIKSIILSKNFDKYSTIQIERSVMGYISDKRPTLNTFNKITAAGITQITTNDSLSKNIYEYYTTELEIFNSILEWEVEASNTEVAYWIHDNNHVEYKYDWDLKDSIPPLFQNNEERRKKLIQLITEPKGRNILKDEYSRKLRILRHYQQSKKRATELIGEIQKELKSR